MERSRSQMATATCSSVGDAAQDTTRHALSFNLLKEVLDASNIEDDEEAVMVTRMRVDPPHVKEFERILRLILKSTHTVGHVSTCVVKPPPGEFTYTSIVKYSSLNAMRQIYPSSVDSDFYKLFAARDSLLAEPPTYQIEAGFGTWIESDGNTRPMRDDSDDANLVYNTIPKPCCDDSCDNPHGLNVRASFVAPTKNFQLFQPRYQRNNKKGGQKNLRCFPCCRNGRHVSSGFCGDSIRVHVAVSRITESGGIKICPISTTQPAVLAYARFLNLEGAFDPAVSGPEVFPGQTIDRYDLLQYVRDKGHPLNPLFPGILRGAAMESTLQSAIFEFNAECKAWQYGWTAPRGQGVSGSDAQHVLEILFVKPMGSYLFCLERLRSDTFSIYSSRRASHANVKPEAEAYEHDEELNDDRGQKRKRAGVVPSPTASTSSAASVSSSGESQWSASARPTSFVDANQKKPSPATSPVVFKVEPATQDFTSLLSAPPAFAQGNGTPTGQLLTGPGFGSTDMPMHSDSSDLVHHMLFADQHGRRVVSSEELPWSELYHLFDTMPMQGDETASNNDMDEDTPVSSPTPSHDSATRAPVTTSSSGAAVILTYL